MRPHSRIRRIAKWTGMAICVLLAGAWASSLVHGYGYSSPRAIIGVYDGCLSVDCIVDRSRFALVSRRLHYRGVTYGLVLPHVAPRLQRAPGLWSMIIPLWLPLTFATAITLWLRRGNAQTPAGSCRCGYDLTGNTSGTCPECGASVAAHQLPHAR